MNEIIKELFNKDCIKEGNFTLKNGEISKYYFDMKNLVSYPQLLKKIGDEIYKLIDMSNCDLICAVPIGALPISTYISVTYNIPMIIVRDKVKTYGSCKQIEGNYNKNSKCVIIEDVITTGSSVNNAINALKDKVSITSVISILNRQQGFESTIPNTSLITKNDITYYKLQKIIEMKKSRLCFSADVEDANKLFEILDNIGEYIIICKIHYDIFKDTDNTIKNKLIEYSIKYNFLIMEDRKFVDISYISQKQYKSYQNWVDLVTVMGFVSDDVVKNMSGVLLVANMSNNIWNMNENAILLAKNNPKNVIGFITQERIKCDNCLSFTPGVNLKNSNIKDQKYRNAKNIDTDVIIVGRGIYNNENYKQQATIYSQI